MNSYVCCGTSSRKGEQIDSLASILKIVAEPNRLKILCVLQNGQHCVCELIEHLKISQSLLSHHLRDLREAKIVVDEKRGKNVYYSLTTLGEQITNLLFKIDR